MFPVTKGKTRKTAVPRGRPDFVCSNGGERRKTYIFFFCCVCLINHSYPFSEKESRTDIAKVLKKF